MHNLTQSKYFSFELEIGIYNFPYKARFQSKYIFNLKLKFDLSSQKKKIM